MKKTIFKILSLALTVGLLASLIIGTVPAGALSATSIDASSKTISASDVTYTIKFTGALNLIPGDEFTVTFPMQFDIGGVYDVNFSPDNGVTWDDLNVDWTAEAANILTFDGLSIPATVGNVWILEIHGVVNPDAAGSYVFSLSTSKEPTPVQTPSITIGSPGIIQYYNAAGAYLGTSATFPELFEEVGEIGEGWTIKVGAGVYMTFVFGPPGDIFYINNDDITLTSSAGPTIIVGNMYINGDDFTMSNVIKGGERVIVNGEDATFENVTFNKTSNKTGPPSQNDFMVYVMGDGASFDGCSFNLDSAAGYQDQGIIVWADDVTIDDCSFKLDQTVAYYPDFGILASEADNLVITNNTFTGNSGWGIVDWWSGDCCDISYSMEIAFNTFTGLEKAIELNYSSAEVFKNTITASTVNNDDYGGAVEIYNWGNTSMVNIYANNFTDNEGFALAGFGDTSDAFIAGNNFVGNEQDVLGAPVDTVLNCVANFWGAAGGPGPGAIIGDNVVYEPFLSVSTLDAFAFGAWERDPDDTGVVNSPSDSVYAGYAVKNYGYDDEGWVVGQTLSGNPAPFAPPFPAVTYFDVYTSEPNDTLMQINLYCDCITEASNVYYWSGDMQGWVLCSDQGVAGSGTYVWFKVGPPGIPNILGNQTVPAPEELQGTYFAIVDGIAPPTETIVPSGPEPGATTGISNIPFSWPTVPGATGYRIVIWTTDPNNPVLTQDSGSPSFMVDSLPAGSYFWKVYAYQGDNILSESAVNSFIAQAPPTTTSAPPPITITTQPPATITITQPQATTVTFQPPDETNITPAWIYVIIGIGAILVIVVIVLIIRTRRTT